MEILPADRSGVAVPKDTPAEITEKLEEGLLGYREDGRLSFQDRESRVCPPWG